MLVRCLRILEGGRCDGRETEFSQGGLEVGGDYVVVGIWSQAESGPEYAIVDEREYPGGTPMLYTSQMFEVLSPKIPSSWVVHDVYGDGKRVTLNPGAWTDRADATEGFFERKSRLDEAAWEAYIREVERMYGEEGRDPPVQNRG